MRPLVIALLTSTAALAGCGIAPTAAPSADQGFALEGKVHGGQQPIVGAHVYLFAANTTGYGGAGIAPSASNASLSLLKSAANTTLDNSGGATNGDYYVTTASDGSFSITTDYSCSAGQQLYMFALGGNPGAGTNSAAGLLAALGNCSTLTSSTYIWINEVSTVAAAYALSGFASDATHISSSGTTLAQTGIANAFLTVGNLVSLSTGAALATTPGGNGTVPQKAINTLANILASCVNSNSSSSYCGTLLGDAPSLTAPPVTPTETATAAINIAHSPATSVMPLYSIATPAVAFAPALTAQPNDFTLGINFTGGGLGSTNNIAIDGSGNVWVANYGSADISKFSPLGVALSPSSGYTGGGMNEPWAVAIDQLGDVWTGNYINVVSNFTSSGVAISPNGDTGGGLNYPFSVAIDGSGSVWIGNYGNTLSKFSSGGLALSPSGGYTGGGLNVSQSVAVDGSGYVWLANANGNSLSKFTSAGVAVTSSSGYTGGGLYYPLGMAIDSAGNVWTANINGNTLSKFSNAGVALSPSGGYSGGGLSHNKTISIDGAGNVFTANVNNNSISEFSSAGVAISPSTGYTGGTLSGPDAVAIDGSGNAWIANGSNSVTELIGLGAPVITPICAGLPAIPTANGTSSLGTRP